MEAIPKNWDKLVILSEPALQSQMKVELAAYGVSSLDTSFVFALTAAGHPLPQYCLVLQCKEPQYSWAGQCAMCIHPPPKGFLLVSAFKRPFLEKDVSVCGTPKNPTFEIQQASYLILFFL